MYQASHSAEYIVNKITVYDKAYTSTATATISGGVLEGWGVAQSPHQDICFMQGAVYCK